jgi:hypothetical protein
MTHDMCIDAILARRRRPGAAPEPYAGEVEQHLASCSDCWAVVALMHESIAGAPVADDARMEELYGCEDVRDRFGMLVDIPPEDIPARDPAAGRHLAWCLACRSRLSTLRAVEQDLASTSVAEEVDAEAPLRALTARLAVAVRAGLAVFTELEGFLPIATMAPAAARGTGETRPKAARLFSDGGGVELRLLARGDARMDLEVQLLEDVPANAMLCLRTAGTNQPIAYQTARRDRPVVFAALPPGSYVLELPGAPATLVAIDVAAAEG